MTAYDARYRDSEDFFRDRRKWMQVCVTESPRGSYDVTLRIDGSYSSQASAERMAGFFQEHIAYLLANLNEGQP